MSPTSTRGEGNTNTSPLTKKRDEKAIRWCFTHNLSTDSENEKDIDAFIESIKDNFKEITKFSIFSLEIGEKNGKKHLQGYVEFIKKMYLSGCKKVIDNTTHWEKSKGDRESNITYCSKKPIKGPFIHDIQKVPEFTEEELGILKKDDFYDWQKEIYDICMAKPDDRTIHWYWCKDGNKGKSAFSRYMAYHHEAYILGGAKKDIMVSIMGDDNKRKIPKKPIMIFDLVRSMEDRISYDAIETLKNGMLIGSKYKGGQRIIPFPVVVCFANFPPDVSKLSKDRWQIVQLLEKGEEVAETEEEEENHLDYGIEDDKFKVYFD